MQNCICAFQEGEVHSIDQISIGFVLLIEQINTILEGQEGPKYSKKTHLDVI